MRRSRPKTVGLRRCDGVIGTDKRGSQREDGGRVGLVTSRRSRGSGMLGNLAPDDWGIASATAQRAATREKNQQHVEKPRNQTIDIKSIQRALSNTDRQLHTRVFRINAPRGGGAVYLVSSAK